MKTLHSSAGVPQIDTSLYLSLSLTLSFVVYHFPQRTLTSSHVRAPPTQTGGFLHHKIDHLSTQLLRSDDVGLRDSDPSRGGMMALKRIYIGYIIVCGRKFFLNYIVDTVLRYGFNSGGQIIIIIIVIIIESTCICRVLWIV